MARPAARRHAPCRDWVSTFALAIARRIGEAECNRSVGLRNTAKRCGNILRAACPIRRPRMRSMPNSKPPIRAMPRVAAPGEWDWPVPSASEIRRSIVRNRRDPGRRLANYANDGSRVHSDHAGFRSRAGQASLCRSRSAASFACRSEARRLPLSLWRRRGGRPITFCATSGTRVQAIARRIFI